MFIGKPAGNYDRILDFSTAVTGNLFFVPTASFLDNINPDAPASAESSGAEISVAATPSIKSSTTNKDGSLGIGSLKGENSHE